MAQPLQTTQFNSALFDDERYAFDEDVQHYITVALPTQTWKRQTQPAWIRKP